MFQSLSKPSQQSRHLVIGSRCNIAQQNCQSESMRLLEGHLCISLSPKRFVFAIKFDEISFDLLVPGLAIVPTILYPP